MLSPSRWWALAGLVAALALVVVLGPPATRGSLAAMTGLVRNSGNGVVNLSLVSPTGLSATVAAGTSVSLSWTAATPNNGNGNGYAITALNNGTSSACPTTTASYTTWIGSTSTATTTFTDTSSIARGTAGTFACYLVQTGYNPTAAPPWSGRPIWTSQGSLAIAAVALGITNVQTGAEALGSTAVAPTLTTASRTGTLLVATIATVDTGATGYTGPAGWTRVLRAINTSAGAVEVWYYPNNPGGITSATFSDSLSAGAAAQLAEFSGVAASSPADRSGSVSVTASTTSATASTSAATSVNGELAVTVFYHPVSGTFTSPSGWTHMVNDGSNGYVADYATGMAAATVSETMTSSAAAVWVGAIATFK